MKRILSYLAVLILTLATAQAASVSLSAVGSGTNALYTGGGRITGITFTATTNVYIKLLDAPSSTLTYTNDAITIYTPTIMTNATGVDIYYQTILGGYVTNAYKYLTNVSSTQAAYTNSYPVLGAWTIPASTTVNLTFSPPLAFVRGLTTTNDTGAGDMTIQFQPR